jgi:uncharacterized protein YdcH (DUF465 family)
MSHVAHDLHSQFPADAAALHTLKLGNAHFRTLSDRYDAVNKDIHRIETGVEPAADERLEGLKKQRLALVDDIAALIAEAKSA